MSEMLKLVAKSKLQDQSQPHRIPLPPCSWQNQNQRQSSPPPSLRAVCSLVVSPPISTVIPWILPAIYVPPSWLWVKEKSRSLDSSQNYYLGSKLNYEFMWLPSKTTHYLQSKKSKLMTAQKLRCLRRSPESIKMNYILPTECIFEFLFYMIWSPKVVNSRLND